MMKMFLLVDTSETIENGNGSRYNYSIEMAILEKRLVLDHSMITMKKIICNLTDLKSCYNQQLPKLGSIIEELAGRN